MAHPSVLTGEGSAFPVPISFQSIPINAGVFQKYFIFNICTSFVLHLLADYHSLFNKSFLNYSSVLLLYCKKQSGARNGRKMLALHKQRRQSVKNLVLLPTSELNCEK